MLFIPTLFMSLLISADGVSAELVSSNTLPACCAFPGFTPLDEHVTFRGFLRCFLIPKKKKKKQRRGRGKGAQGGQTASARAETPLGFPGFSPAPRRGRWGIGPSWKIKRTRDKDTETLKF